MHTILLVAFIFIVVVGIAAGVLGIIFRRKAKEVVPGFIKPFGEAVGGAAKAVEQAVDPVVHEIGKPFTK